MQIDYQTYSLLLFFLCIPLGVYAQNSEDTTGTGGGSITLPEPTNFSREIIYDPVSGNYLVYKKIGDLRLPIPEVWTVDEYRQYMYDLSESQYMANKAILFNSTGDSPRDDQGLVPQIQTGSEA